MKYFESDSVKLKSHHRSFHLPASTGVIGTKALPVSERLFGSQQDGKTEVEDTGKNLVMTP